MLYRGDLLDGFVIDEEPFEQWLVHERERLRELALDALARLLRHQNSLEATEAATQTARRLLTLDPLREAVHRVLMRLHVRAGRREAALRQYEICIGLLRRELQLGPEPETRQLYEEILRTRERATAPETVELHAESHTPTPEPASEVRNGATTDGREQLLPRSNSFLTRSQERSQVVQKALERLRILRTAASASLVASRQALMATRALNAGAHLSTHQSLLASVTLMDDGEKHTR